MEYIYINTRTVPPWRARIWAALQKLFGQKTEIVRISDSITQPDVHDGSIPSPDFDTLLQMLCVDSDSLKFNKRLRWIGDIEMNNGFINKYISPLRLSAWSCPSTSAATITIWRSEPHT